MTDALAGALAGLIRTLIALLVVALGAGVTAVVVQDGPEALLQLAQAQLQRVVAMVDQAPGAQARADESPSGLQEAATPPAAELPLYLPEEQAEPARRENSPAAATPGRLVPVATASSVPVRNASLVRGGEAHPESGAAANDVSGGWDSLHARLRRLGVVRWHLESVADGSACRVRFRCELPHPVRPTWRRFLQAEGTTPQEAINRVLAVLEKNTVAKKR